MKNKQPTVNPCKHRQETEYGDICYKEFNAPAGSDGPSEDAEPMPCDYCNSPEVEEMAEQSAFAAEQIQTFDIIESEQFYLLPNTKQYVAILPKNATLIAIYNSDTAEPQLIAVDSSSAVLIDKPIK